MRSRRRNPELLVVNNPRMYVGRHVARRKKMRRRRRRNSWPNAKRRHRLAALKGWRKRRRGGRKTAGKRCRRRKRNPRRRGRNYPIRVKYRRRYYTWSQLAKKLGQRKARAYWRRKKGKKWRHGKQLLRTAPRRKRRRNRRRSFRRR